MANRNENDKNALIPNSIEWLRKVRYHSINKLHQPLGGIFSQVSRIRPQNGAPNIATASIQLGDLSQILTTKRPDQSTTARASISLSATGTGGDETEALFLALMEGLERYANCIFEDDQLIWATATELGGAALDLDAIPRCSARELSHPRCSLRLPDKSLPVRWVRAISLLDGRLVYVPAVMVYLNACYASPGERICLPITTGSAAHTSYERALLNGILEVVERDAISIVWLQKLPLRRISLDYIPPVLEDCWNRYERGSRDLEYIFFDATLDLGIPTVYGLQIAPADRRVTTLVSCSTDLNPAAAIAKVIRDMSAIRVGFQRSRPLPETWDDYHGLFDGAIYMARAEQAPGFDFLLRAADVRSLSNFQMLDRGSDAENLQLTLDRFRKFGMDIFAVDLSTDETLRCGVRVVHVLIPSLQPLSFSYRARYLGHSRLYDLPRTMGYPVLAEEDVNILPQPFA